MPNCKEHDDCDLVCPVNGYYCFLESHEPLWVHVKRPDMPDDPEAYYNERAERMP